MKGRDRHWPLPFPVLLLPPFQSEKAVTLGGALERSKGSWPTCLGFPSATLGRHGERQVVSEPAGRKIPAPSGNQQGRTGLAVREKSILEQEPRLRSVREKAVLWEGSEWKEKSRNKHVERRNPRGSKDPGPATISTHLASPLLGLGLPVLDSDSGEDPIGPLGSGVQSGPISRGGDGVT